MRISSLLSLYFADEGTNVRERSGVTHQSMENKLMMLATETHTWIRLHSYLGSFFLYAATLIVLRPAVHSRVVVSHPHYHTSLPALLIPAVTREDWEREWRRRRMKELQGLWDRGGRWLNNGEGCWNTEMWWRERKLGEWRQWKGIWILIWTTKLWRNIL